MDTSTPLSFVKVIGQITDPYERQARLFPALIAISPFLVMIFGLYQDQLSKFHTLVVAILSCGGLFLLSELARRRGKMKEKSLWASWGGAPSVQVLRYANDTFDDVSTSRYHSILSKKIGVKFPSQHEERSNPCEADKIYASAGNYLRNATRDKGKFNLLFRDNISYGFRRNGYGLKWIGVTICFLCLIWVFVRGNINTFSLRLYSGNGIESVLLPGEWITVGMSLIMLVVWLLLFTESAVREAGFSYAERLILACEVLPKAKNAKVQTNKNISPTENT